MLCLCGYIKNNLFPENTKLTQALFSCAFVHPEAGQEVNDSRSLMTDL